MNRKLVFLLLLIFLSLNLRGQSPTIDSLKLLLNETESTLEKAQLKLQLAKAFERVDINTGKKYALEAASFNNHDSLHAEALNQLGRYYFFTAQLDSASHYFENAKAVLTKMGEKDRVPAVDISLGAIYLRQGNYDKTIRTLTKTVTYFEEKKDSINMGKCYSNVATAFAELGQYPKAIEYSEKALDIFRRKKLLQFEMITLPNLATQYYKNGDTLVAIQYNAEAEALATKLNDNRSLSMVYNNLGEIYLHKNLEKAQQYLEKTLQLKNDLNLVKGLEITYSNLGYVLLKKNQFEKAIPYFEKASEDVKGKQLVLVYNNLKEAHKGLGQTALALAYSEKATKLNDSLLNSEFQQNFAEIQTRYETEKKEKEILELTAQNQETEYKRVINRNYLIAALAVLFITIGIGYLLLKNNRRKQLIALQEEQIKTQDFEQQLKDQELAGIDAIIEAQEKEREKIASDLHDNLGSKVATLNMYLEGFEKKSQDPTYFTKIKSLTEETYLEIRKTAQNKNFGAFISKGLIPSAEAIARQISEASGIEITVRNIDMESRIDNSIEIQLFRVIQELLTNIIKHANASEAVIQFSEEENILTVMVEDNGNGFDLHQDRSGLGLESIEKRIKKINGDIVIDTSVGNGTTVILNIPIV